LNRVPLVVGYTENANGTIEHLWVVDVRPDGISLKAVDDDGITLDAFTLP